jgi:hypothetical protein
VVVVVAFGEASVAMPATSLVAAIYSIDDAPGHHRRCPSVKPQSMLEAKMTFQKYRRLRTIGIGLGVLALVVVTAAIAGHRPGHTEASAGSFLGKQVVRDTARATTTSTTFVNLPGSGVTFGVPSGTTRFIEARFTAESRCTGGTPGNWCSVRIVVRNTATGVTRELHPRSGSDFAFDSVGADDFWEAHAMERSVRLGPGRYTLTVQWMTTGASTTFELDDWHLAVERLS